jgi:hypothetical protein
MADDKDYTSLLGRSSGSSWGDIAGAYLSGGKKKDNRARNVLLATLFFNAKEANMQSKVMKNLKELEDSKAIELAKLNKQWETREKLQTEYESVKDKGAYGYYKADAETAFEETFGTDPKYKLQSFQPTKIEWMKKYTSEKEADLNKRYSGVDTSITVKEEFAKPINDYYKAKKQDYLNPQNTSLVHKALGKIGFGTDRSEETGNFLDKKGDDVLLTFKNNKDEHVDRINKLTTQELAEINTDNFEIDKSPVITPVEFNTLLQEAGAGISGTSASQLRSQRIAFSEWSSNNKTYDGALTAISNAVIGHDTNQTAAQVAEVKREYIAINGAKPVKGEENYSDEALNKWNRGLKTNTAIAFGMQENLSDQRINRANELFELGLNKGLYKAGERKEILKEIIGKDLRDATGAIDYNQMKADIIREKTLENLLLLRDKESTLGMNTQKVINSISFVEKEDKLVLQSELSEGAYALLKDTNFDMVEFNKVKNNKNDNNQPIVSSLDKETIRELQESIWLSDGTRKAIYSGNSIIAQIKELGL